MSESSSPPSSVSARLLSPEEIAARAGGQVTFLRLPERPTVFSERALRLRQLAAGHPMRDFLLFAAALAESQHRGLQQERAVTVPDAARIEAAVKAGTPTLDTATWPREAGWLDELRGLLQDLRPAIAGTPVQAVAERLTAAEAPWIERQADRLLGGVTLGLDLATAPLIAAGLQQHFTRLVTETARVHANARPEPFGRTDDATRCPCCGTRPTASITRIGADESGFRYLQCALCSTQWHVVRVKCARCESTKGISYRSLQPVEGHVPAATGANEGAVQAECCSECGHYLKIVHMAKDPQVEPMADDLASVTLDLLVGEEGLHRHGLNLWLLFGEPDEAAEGAGESAGTAPGGGG